MKKLIAILFVSLFVLSISLTAQADSSSLVAMERKIAALLADRSVQQDERTYNYATVFAYSDNTEYWWSGLSIFNLADNANRMMVGCFDTDGNAVAAGTFTLTANAIKTGFLSALMRQGTVSGRVSAIAIFGTGDFIANRFIGNTEGGFGEIEKEAEFYSDKQTQCMLCPDGSYSDSQKQYLTNSMYKLLGMLQEYISRFSYITGEPYPDLVEFFFPYPSSEAALADYFEEIILEYRAESQLQFEYTRETGSQGHVYFYSTELSSIINSFYIKADGSLATLDRNVFCEASEENLLSYAEGAYMRFGIENKNLIEMPNAPYKMVTIGCVLKELGCSNVAVYIPGPPPPTAGGGGPGSYTLIFEPNELVINRLGIQEIVTRITGGTLYQRID